MKRFPPEVLAKIKQKLNAANKDFWCVLYDYQLGLNLEKYLECFDGITFWLWGCEKIKDMETYLKQLFALAKGKPVMLGMYLWDYVDVGKQPMDSALFEKQLQRYFGLLREKKIEGIVFCSSTVGDADLETNKILKRYVAEYGDEEI